MNGPMRVSFVAAVLLILALSGAPAWAARCGPCEVAQERCSANCFGLGKAEIGGCLRTCDNAAATCSCDEAVTLSSEDFVARFGSSAVTKLGSPFVTELAEACHSTTVCGTAYPSCASWSGYADCGDIFCGSVRGCGDCEEFICPGPGLKQYRERFRVCFNALGQSCTEYQRTVINLSCEETC
jgi:hypothetical protein